MRDMESYSSSASAPSACAHIASRTIRPILCCKRFGWILLISSGVFWDILGANILDVDTSRSGYCICHVSYGRYGRHFILDHRWWLALSFSTGNMDDDFGWAASSCICSTDTHFARRCSIRISGRAGPHLRLLAWQQLQEVVIACECERMMSRLAIADSATLGL